MGIEIDLLKNYPKTKRNVQERGVDKTEENRAIARQFGKDFFDGDRKHGYGGFNYHPKFWQPVIPTLQGHFNLSAKSSVLDVGCGKGFMMHDLSMLIPELEILGIDISSYAKDHAIDSMKDNITVGNANNLPYPDNYFDLVISINCLHNLPLIDCKEAFREINRVTNKDAFVMNDAWKDASGEEAMLKWNLTALTYMSTSEWKELFKEVSYSGDYYWFFAQ